MKQTYYDNIARVQLVNQIWRKVLRRFWNVYDYRDISDKGWDILEDLVKEQLHKAELLDPWKLEEEDENI